MRQIQNRDNQACNSNDNHKLFVCTHKHPLLCKTQGEECSRPTGCRGKYIICAGAILCVGGAGEGHSLRWKAAIGERKIAFGSEQVHASRTSYLLATTRENILRCDASCSIPPNSSGFVIVTSYAPAGDRMSHLFPFAVIVHKVNIVLPTFRCVFNVCAVMRGSCF